ncbi:MAG TPA: YcnI family protein [Ramlibacter sp.]|nr:YcnI family protein [Ramlibacter sp.]
MKTITRSCVVLAAFAAFAGAACAHISLQQPRAEAGRPYEAVLRIGHGCDGAATTGVAVQIPKGFENAKPLPKAGWKVAVQGGAATWTAATPEAALPNGQRGEFVLAGTAPAEAGAMWLKVLQTCQQGSLDWSQVPAEGTSTKGMKFPAVLLQVVSPGDSAAPADAHQH